MNTYFNTYCRHLLVLVICLSGAVVTSRAQQAKAAHFAPVAVLELFTSQGCSSCPPADRLLSTTIHDAGSKGQAVFALSFHVDYWNRLGWADPFSNKAFSERQAQYVSALHLESAYTPQLICNGRKEAVGSNASFVHDALAAALAEPALVQFSRLSVTEGPGGLRVDYGLAGDFAGCVLNIAMLSLHEITPVKKGENSGRTLSNDNVVRQFIQLGAQTKGAVLLQPVRGLNHDNTAIVAYVQQKNTMKIIGAATTH